MCSNVKHCLFLMSPFAFICLGDESADRVLRVILGNANFAGAVLACFLDNTIPGKLMYMQYFPGVILLDAKSFFWKLINLPLHQTWHYSQ